ncbi:hypothetical protein [Desertibacillus haloalkaliphilus]|uniref:hypothetical protein n=1 Tax=Desertibacillus haloalkaliphilus TaxID=1328930 RepID=UPI001C258342|nr:hypothetical protein [Desertibacillus haloalkaliphilus]MBU8908252.1 hypothetical protein [Desertibacillus haloalkaliphilus]
MSNQKEIEQVKQLLKRLEKITKEKDSGLEIKEESDSPSNESGEIVEWVPVKGRDHVLERRTRERFNVVDVLVACSIAFIIFLAVT